MKIACERACISLCALIFFACTEESASAMHGLTFVSGHCAHPCVTMLLGVKTAQERLHWYATRICFDHAAFVFLDARTHRHTQTQTHTDTDRETEK